MDQLGSQKVFFTLLEATCFTLLSPLSKCRSEKKFVFMNITTRHFCHMYNLVGTPLTVFVFWNKPRNVELMKISEKMWHFETIMTWLKNIRFSRLFSNVINYCIWKCSLIKCINLSSTCIFPEMCLIIILEKFTGAQQISAGSLVTVTSLMVRWQMVPLVCWY